MCLENEAGKYLICLKICFLSNCWMGTRGIKKRDDELVRPSHSQILAVLLLHSVHNSVPILEESPMKKKKNEKKREKAARSRDPFINEQDNPL